MTALLMAALLAEPQRRPELPAPKVGSMAPELIADSFDTKDTFKLSQNRGKKATVLIFGSCT